MFTPVVIIISLIFSFFFSGLEIAYISANKLQMHVDSRKDTLAGRLFAHIINSPVRFLVTLLLGNTLSLVFFGFFSAKMILVFFYRFHYSSASILVIQTVVTTIIVLVVADFIPKNLFRANPNGVLKILTLPCIIIYYLLLPFTGVALWIAYFLMKKLSGVNLFKYKSTFTKTDLHGFINDNPSMTMEGSEEEESEVKIFRKALSFPDVRVRDCIIPRMEIIALDISEGFAKLKEKFEESGLSRILIYKENLDNPLGYIHFHEMFRTATGLQDILIPVPLIPESMPARDALRIFMQQHKSLAVVVDEFGMTAGIITTEDILEKIFGEIDDEYDNEELIERHIARGEYIFSARHKIDYLNQKYGIQIPLSEDYITLGGFILNFTGAIPKTREIITIQNFNIRILSATPTHIEQVYLINNKAHE